jgi:hypothetical protein
MVIKLLEQVPRYLSLLGLLGLIGVAGIFNPQLMQYSALSFLSYLCYFRFFCWFAKPSPPVTATSVRVWILGIIVGILAMAIFPSLFDNSPIFGFIGFAGYLGLYGSQADDPLRV